MTEKNAEQIVESLLNEGDAHALAQAIDAFERVMEDQGMKTDLAAAFAVRGEIWGHLDSGTVGGLKNKLDLARVAYMTAVKTAKDALSKAHAYRPPVEHPEYDTAVKKGSEKGKWDNVHRMGEID